MKLDKNIEEKIKEKALELSKYGRGDWDQKHIITAVKWIKRLIEEEGGNEKVLIPAAYLHDSGYEEMRKGYTHKELMKAKPGHAEMGAENAKEFLPTLNYFTDKEIEEIAYLIANHDKHNNIKELHRQLLFEADGLAQISWDECPPNYSKESTLDFLKNYYAKRRKYIKTEFTKNLTEKMMKKVDKYLKNWKD